MNELRPLLDEDATSIEAEILRSARARLPPRGASKRALAALGLGGAVATTAGGAVAAPTVALIVKWMAVGVLLALGGFEVGHVVLSVPSQLSELRPSTRPEPSKSVDAPRMAEPTPAAASAPPVARAPEGAVGVAATPAVLASPVPTVTARAVPQLSQPALGADTATPMDPKEESVNVVPARRPIDEEIALLDAARAAVSGRDCDRALRLLQDHHERFPNGQLVQEFTYVRVKTLLECGQKSEAESLAQRFLQAFPDSPHAKRIKALLEP
jgi:hypothetical protein